MESLIKTFYQAFDRLDAEAMCGCYHPNLSFEDPAFGKLNADQAKDMWRMLCATQNKEDFKIIFKINEINSDRAKVDWEAFYTFSKTGRPVHNKISASMEFKDGLIIQHVDRFDLYKWSRQALGFSGVLMGWTGFFKRKLQMQTQRMLAKYQSKNS